jgi:hypothetical protein
MKRRQFIKGSIVSGGAIIGLGGGALLLIDGTNRDELTIDFALKKLDVLSHTNLINLGEWNSYQIFTHCAQSVEYSMSQFPLHRSSFFKSTIGKLAFSIFSSKGKMTHDLSEPIPGAPSLTSSMDVALALNRLQKSLIDFDKYLGPIAPHFAYGQLTKKEFEMAHVMHLYNHLQEIKS